jgi:hypothetical protein
MPPKVQNSYIDMWEAFIDTCVEIEDAGKGQGTHGAGDPVIWPTGHWRTMDDVYYYATEMLELEALGRLRPKAWVSEGLLKEGVSDFWLLERLVAACMQYNKAQTQHLFKTFFTAWAKGIKADGRPSQAKERWVHFCTNRLSAHHRQEKAQRLVDVLESLGLLYPGYWRLVYARTHGLPEVFPDTTFELPWDDQPTPNDDCIIWANRMYDDLPYYPHPADWPEDMDYHNENANYGNENNLNQNNSNQNNFNQNNINVDTSMDDNDDSEIDYLHMYENLISSVKYYNYSDYSEVTANPKAAYERELKMHSVYGGTPAGLRLATRRRFKQKTLKSEEHKGKGSYLWARDRMPIAKEKDGRAEEELRIQKEARAKEQAEAEEELRAAERLHAAETEFYEEAIHTLEESRSGPKEASSERQEDDEFPSTEEWESMSQNWWYSTYERLAAEKAAAKVDEYQALLDMALNPIGKLALAAQESTAQKSRLPSYPRLPGYNQPSRGRLAGYDQPPRARVSRSPMTDMDRAMSAHFGAHSMLFPAAEVWSPEPESRTFDETRLSSNNSMAEEEDTHVSVDNKAASTTDTAANASTTPYLAATTDEHNAASVVNTVEPENDAGPVVENTPIVRAAPGVVTAATIRAANYDLLARYLPHLISNPSSADNNNSEVASTTTTTQDSEGTMPTTNDSDSTMPTTNHSVNTTGNKRKRSASVTDDAATTTDNESGSNNAGSSFATDIATPKTEYTSDDHDTRVKRIRLSMPKKLD